MDKTKQTLVIALVAVLVVVAGGWYFLISPQKSSVASLNAQTSTVDSSNATLLSKINQLKAEAADLPGEQTALAAIAKRLPPNAQYANLLYDLQHAADAANVDLQVVTPSPPVLAVTAAVAAPAPVPSAAGKSGATARVTIPKPAANQLYQIPLSLTVSGNYFDLEMFIHSLEGMQRAMLIGQLTFTKSPTTAVTNPPISINGGNGATKVPTAGSGNNNAATDGSSTDGTSTGSTGKGATGAKAATKGAAKGLPGTPAGANGELNGRPSVPVDGDTISLVLTGAVFSMYSPAGAAAAAASVPTTPATTK